MTDNEIRLRFEAVGKLLEQKPDFKQFIDSKEFKLANLADTDAAHFVLKNKEFTLSGDVRSIHILEFGRVSISVTIGNTFNGVSKSTEIRVDVPDNLAEDVLKLKPDTGVVFGVKYKKFNVVIDVFELITIKESNKPLNFPYCICLGDNDDPRAYADVCHRIFGYSKEDYHEHCPLCGSKTIKISDVYSKECQEIIKNSRM